MVSQSEFVDMLAISQSTPGPIGINMATFAGHKIAGVPGGIVATLGMVSPSLLIIIMIAAWMKNFASNPFVKNAMSGIRPAALGLIGSAAWFISEQALLASEDRAVSLPALLLFIAMGLACQLKPASPMVYIAVGGLLGILLL